MKTVSVGLKENSYKIRIGTNLIHETGEILLPLALGDDALVITNPVVKKLHGRALRTSLKKAGFTVTEFVVPDGEQSKSAKETFRLYEEIVKKDTLKRPFIVAFGGGVVGDLAGFVAATYKRGIPYIQIPTTLLAQIDSAIGGKVAIDLPSGKNLVGAFYQPRVVISDLSVLETLPNRQIRNGFAEAIKYGIISDPRLFRFFEIHASDVLAKRPAALARTVISSSSIKARIVIQDEKETKGIRTALNFGHTLGHAIEAATRYRKYAHGEAIALGMRMAADISRRLGYLDEDSDGRINMLITEAGLPRVLQNLAWKDISAMMVRDKKFVNRKNRFVLIDRIGHVRVEEGIPAGIIRNAFLRYAS